MSNLRGILIVSLVILLIALSVATYVCLNITKNINILNHGMRRVRENDLDVSVEIHSGDELEKMSGIFNSMVSSIKRLMKENQQQEQEKKEIEINFLQAQINPHFLSNTLNTITWMANMQQANNISQLSGSLASLLQATIYKGEDLITVEEELAHVQSYIDIEQVAYPGNFEVTYQVSPEILQYKVLRFLLQPIVENSIIHSFTNIDADELGQILIIIFADEQNINLVVEDNGGKIKPYSQRVESKEIEKKKYNKVGINNIDERIKIYFGEEYGVTTRIIDDQFFRVTLTLPVIKGEVDL